MSKILNTLKNSTFLSISFDLNPMMWSLDFWKADHKLDEDWAEVINRSTFYFEMQLNLLMFRINIGFNDV